MIEKFRVSKSGRIVCQSPMLPAVVLCRSASTRLSSIHPRPVDGATDEMFDISGFGNPD